MDFQKEHTLFKFKPVKVCILRSWFSSKKVFLEDSISYPISFNGKTRLNLELPATMGKEEVEQYVLANEEVQQRLEGATPKKVIVVPKRIVNIVV